MGVGGGLLTTILEQKAQARTTGTLPQPNQSSKLKPEAEKAQRPSLQAQEGYKLHQGDLVAQNKTHKKRKKKKKNTQYTRVPFHQLWEIVFCFIK